MKFHTLHVIGSNQFGGAERFMVRVVQALNDEGHPASALVRPNSPIVAELPKGTETHYAPMQNKWDLWSVHAIRKQIRRLQPDVVQTYMGRATRLTHIPSRWNIPHVARLGGYYKIEGYYRHADAWVGNTRGICDYLVTQGLPSEKIFHIGNFVTPRSETPKTKCDALRVDLGLPADAIVLFSLGRHIAKKGFHVLLKAMNQIKGHIGGRPVHLLLAGDGPMHEELLRQKRGYSLENRVHCVGWQSDPSIFFDLADLFICPSLDEPLGNVILEGWAHRLPVISTSTAGGTELIEDGTNGLLVPCGDSAALASTIQEVLEGESAVLESIADAGHQTLLREHSQKAVVEAYAELYRQLLAPNGRMN